MSSAVQLTLRELDCHVSEGALWSVPSVYTHWFSPMDGGLIRVTGGPGVRPHSYGGRTWTVGLPGGRRSLSSIYADALGFPRRWIRGGVWPRDLPLVEPWSAVYSVLKVFGGSELYRGPLAP
jgi:hypothetical protein